MSTTKRLRTKDEELVYRRVAAMAAHSASPDDAGPLRITIPESVPLARYGEIAKMVSDDIKRMAKVPL